MREKYWAMYEQIKYSERYFYFYRASAINKDRIIKIALVVTSLSSIANLWFWEKVPFIWAVVAAAAQVMSAVMYLFPYSDQITSLNYLLPELDHLLNYIDRDWDRINVLQELSEAEINDLVLKYNERYSGLEERFIGTTQFPRNKKCERKADEECRKFKFSRFGITETNYLEEVLNNASQ